MFVLENYKALGTSCFIEIFEEISELEIRNIEDSIKTLIFEFEKNYSRFKSTSLTSLLNQNREITSSNKEFIELLELSENYRKKTGGVFDIKLGSKLTKNGYGQNYCKLPDTETCNIFLNKDYIKLEGIFEIDLGGIGKSFCIQKVSRLLEENYNLKYYLINFGGDIYLTSDNEQEIEILLENPIDNSKTIGKVYLKNCAVCGSSPYKRVWSNEGKKFNHLISKSNDLVKYSSFVISSNIIDADVYATVLCISPDFDEEIDINYIILDEKGDIYKVR